jgi:hypothetical protein
VLSLLPLLRSSFGHLPLTAQLDLANLRPNVSSARPRYSLHCASLLSVSAWPAHSAASLGHCFAGMPTFGAKTWRQKKVCR